MRSLFVLALASCGNPDEPARECHDVFYADQDGDAFGDPESSVEDCQVPDGYTVTAGDCDDTRYTTRPGADERCNGADDDCDGSIDEDAIDPTVWYEDTDGDGYGDEADTTEGCVAPKGYAPADGDCDVTDPAIHPGADEICDGIDNDCDRLPDEDDPGLTGDTQTWYIDGDYDGFGDPLAPITACDQPLGGVFDNTDCNDDAAAAHPGAQEICDGIDDDCDELVDDDDENILGVSQWWPDNDGDGFGAGIAVIQCFPPSGYADNRGDCDDGDPAVGDADYYYGDGDGDGYGASLLDVSCAPPATGVLVPGDCDDADPTAYPGAAEICDGTDDNCDSLVDEADPLVVLPTWYGDDDMDGYGEDTDLATSCVAPEGYVSAGGDCDDADDFTFPEAYELCDGIDNDCNATADDAIDYVDWYADVDGDGHGDATDSVNDCSQPSGYVLPHDDCDDASSDVHPDAVEVCPNGTDDDCDLGIDNCATDLATADLIIEGVDEGVPLGGTIAVGDVDADGTSDLILGGWKGAGFDGTVFVVLGPTTGTRTTSDAIAISNGLATGNLGSAIDAGDADGDGVDDLLLGAPSDDLAYLFLGPVDSDRTVTDAEASIAGLVGDVASTFVEIARDVDGDGSADLIFGAPEGGASYRGRVYVIPGMSSGAVDLGTDPTYTYAGRFAGDALGYSGVDVGDTNGDGIDELALAATASGTGGVVYVVEGGVAAGSYDVDSASVATFRGGADSRFGWSLASADSDNDGTDDLLVGAPDELDAAGNSVGAVYAFLAPFDTSSGTTDAQVNWFSTVPSALFGYAIAADGDVDADETPDLLIGAPGAHVADTEGYGCAYLQVGLATGSIDATTLRSFPAAAMDGTGQAVRFVGDWTGDDGAEIAIGSPAADTSALTYVGAARVFFSDTLLP